MVSVELKPLPWVSLHFKIVTLKKYVPISRSVFLHNIYVQLYLYKENNVLLQGQHWLQFGTYFLWLHPVIDYSDETAETSEPTTQFHFLPLCYRQKIPKLTNESCSYLLFTIKCFWNDYFLWCAANRNVIHMKRKLMLRYSTGPRPKKLWGTYL